MYKKHRFLLPAEERETLERLAQGGGVKNHRARHARILLALDDSPANKDLTDAKIAALHRVSEATVRNIRRRYATGGIKAVLERARNSPAANAKMDEEAEARILALAAGSAPEGHPRWTVRLLAAKAVEAGILESISHTAVWDLLKRLA